VYSASPGSTLERFVLNPPLRRLGVFDNSWQVVGTALATSGLLVLGPTPVPAEDTSTFPASVTTQAQYRLGDPIDMTFALHNPTAQDYSLLVWDTPLEGRGREAGSYVKLRRGPREVAYQGRMVTRSATAGARSYRTVHAGETVRETVDLTTAFAITQPGTYTVTLDSWIRDAVTGSAPAARTSTRFTAHDLAATTATFEVLPGGEPRLTAGAQRRQANEKAAQKAKFKNMSDRQERDLRKAIPKSNNLVGEALDELDDNPRSNEYKRWFGNWKESRYDKVVSIYEKIGDDATDATYDGDCDGEDEDLLAWMDLSDPNYIWLCTLFWDLPISGGDYSMAGTILHEESHFAGTDDIEYGPEDCEDLADDHPDRAVRNADNYSFYADDVD
jgi:peptidyl-Lys metalloendopeptidase